MADDPYAAAITYGVDAVMLPQRQVLNDSVTETPAAPTPSTAQPTVATGSGSPTSPPTGTTTSVIHVRVNPESKIKIASFVDLINKTPGIVPEFKGKIILDTKTNTIMVPDYSRSKVVPGKEWLLDLGKAGDDWEVITATLSAVLDGPTSFKFTPDLQGGEERGYATSSDPDDSLLSPAYDLTPIKKGLILGLTIPNRALVNKNPPPPQLRSQSLKAAKD